MKYDYLIVGAGLFGSVVAHELMKKGKKCLLIEKRNHIGGNCYTKRIKDINVHYYGAHIFHTQNKGIWDYVNQFANFNNYVNSPIANYEGELYSLPFNMNTFYQLWGTKTPQEAKAKIEEQRKIYETIKEPKNLEEQALVLGGKDIYEKLIKGYSEKQWGMEATKIPAFVIRRLPFRFTFNNNYFDHRYQGIPEGGYTPIFEQLLQGTDVRLGSDFLSDKKYYFALASKIIFTGTIDSYYNYSLGVLSYRGLKFEHELLENNGNYQGNAVINYTSSEIPYTRIIEHKHFEFGTQPYTVITKEYPQEWKIGDESFYPVNNDANMCLYEKYRKKALTENNVYFGGRLGEYKYLDMDQVIQSALDFVGCIN